MQVSMVNIRIPDKQSDVLITFMRPSQDAFLESRPDAVFKDSLASFRINDYGLFG